MQRLKFSSQKHSDQSPSPEPVTCCAVSGAGAAVDDSNMTTTGMKKEIPPAGKFAIDPMRM
jgi:hypothetical protein